MKINMEPELDQALEAKKLNFRKMKTNFIDNDGSFFTKWGIENGITHPRLLEVYSIADELSFNIRLFITGKPNLGEIVGNMDSLSRIIDHAWQIKLIASMFVSCKLEIEANEYYELMSAYNKISDKIGNLLEGARMFPVVKIPLILNKF